MINKLDDDRWYEGRFMYYHDLGRITTQAGTKGKTHVFVISNKLDQSHLGQVRWFGRFRKYCYFTNGSDCVFDNNCMKEIIEFCEMKTQEVLDFNKEQQDKSRKLREKESIMAARLRREQQELELKHVEG